MLTLRLRRLEWAIELVVLSTVSLVLFVVSVTALVLVVVWVGIPVFVLTNAVTRRLAWLRRRRVGALLGRPIASPYLQVPERNLLARFAAVVGDPATRRDLAWVFVDGTIGLVLSIVGVVEGVLDLLLWWLAPGLAVRAHARIDEGLLSTSEKSRLALRVQQLTDSRAETVDTSAAELRRIERDLHDGAQARLVSLGMSLAMAEQEIARNPDSARELLVEAREATGTALAELRDLVRGIHPPVLADRGLVEAIRALALAAPMPVHVESSVGGRLPAPVESAAYFAVAEALANAIKHSDAQHVGIAVRHDGRTLGIVVSDDGIGAADVARGTGLRGIARRLSAFDGTLDVLSPPGGPTTVAMVLPCASSSPRISPSSATG